MNKKILTTLCACAVATGAAHAFTLDFNALVVPAGTSVSSDAPLIIDVPGYGDVRFEVAPGVTLEVGDTHRNDGGELVNTLQLDAGEAVLVTFLGPAALDVNFDFAGINPGSEVPQAVNNVIRPSEYQVNLIASPGSDGAGISSISWQANEVPEPSSAMLGAAGACLMVLRRRRSNSDRK